MKAVKLFLLTLCIAYSCTKSVPQHGDLKVTVQFVPQNSYFFMKGNMTVQLIQNGNVIATQYTSSPSATLDFGQYNYGSYTIKASCHEGYTYSPNDWGTYSSSNDFQINSPTASPSITIQG